MKTKSEHISSSGNALLYVLIAIALFGALSFTISRQSRNSESGTLDEAKVELYATQILSYARQVQSVIDQMTITGSSMSEFDFVRPGEAGFATAPHIHKVYHPQGGGLSPANLPAGTTQDNAEQTPGWYLGVFNTVEWTDSTGTDMILTAHNLSAAICASINNKITGSSTIPALVGDGEDYLLDTSTNNNLTISACGACEGYMSLCVQNAAGTSYSFYNVIADR